MERKAIFVGLGGVFVALLAAATFWPKAGDDIGGVPRYAHDGKEIPEEVRAKIREIQEQHQAAVQPAAGHPKNEDFRSTLSDLAWGRKERKAAGAGQPPQEAKTPSVDERSQMEMLKSRVEYCAKNRGKDPSCP